MTCFTIWIDRATTKVFQFSREINPRLKSGVTEGRDEVFNLAPLPLMMEKATISLDFPGHHTHPLDSSDHEKREKKRFGEVAESLSSDCLILILGPGVAKYHFQNYLNEHHPILAKKVVACETVDHPSDDQITAQAMKYFKVSTNYGNSA